jgi:hypothetical protein
MQDVRRQSGALNEVFLYTGRADPNCSLSGGAFVQAFPTSSTDHGFWRAAYSDSQFSVDARFSIGDKSGGVVAQLCRNAHPTAPSR